MLLNVAMVQVLVSTAAASDQSVLLMTEDALDRSRCDVAHGETCRGWYAAV